jgi:hypothetical protein
MTIFNKIFFSSNDSMHSKLIKIWAYIIVFITVIYLLYSMTFESDFLNGVDFETFNDIKSKREYLKSITPNYPPPLTNFMEPADVFKL